MQSIIYFDLVCDQNNSAQSIVCTLKFINSTHFISRFETKYWFIERFLNSRSNTLDKFGFMALKLMAIRLNKIITYNILFGSSYLIGTI